MMSARSWRNCVGCILCWCAAPASAIDTVIDDFESYAPGPMPLTSWTVVDPVTPGSPKVVQNIAGMSGNQLQFISRWSPDAFDTISLKLPNALAADGDYIQVATNMFSGQAMASLSLQPGAYLPNASQPWAVIGMDTAFNQFNHGHQSAYNSETRFGSIVPGDWYYLRATVRDAAGNDGIVDAYDFQVFSNADGTGLIDQKAGISFRNGYAGSLSHIALRVYEQLDHTSTVLFDRITTNRTTNLPAPPRPVDFGRQWVKDNPFLVFARGADDANDPLVNQLQLNAVEVKQAFRAEVAVNAGKAWIAHPSDQIYATGVPLLTELLKAQIADYVVQGGMHGIFQLADEPAIETLDNHAAIAQWVHETYPSLMTFATAGWGPTPQYIDALMTKLKPDALMYDIYPVLRPSGMDLDYHFEHLALIRQKATQYNVPAYAWLQGFEDSDRLTPSESELRLVAYSYLTAGFKGFGYYRYKSNATETGLVDANGQPRNLFNHAASLNSEIMMLGSVLRHLDNVDLRFIPGTRYRFGIPAFGTISNADLMPDGLTLWDNESTADPYLLSVGVQSGNQGAQKNGLIGLFRDENDQPYFMLSNLNHGANLSADAASLTFILTFQNALQSIWWLNPVTGQTEQVMLTNNTLVWTLRGGTGDLFGYSPQFIPEPSAVAFVIFTVILFIPQRRCRKC